MLNDEKTKLAATPPPTILDRATKHASSITGIFAAVGAIVALFNGGAEKIVDWASSADQTQSQVTAIDERVKLLEEGKAVLEADRAELARLSQKLDDVIDDVGRAGVDVTELKSVQRSVELRVERIDAQLGMIMRDERAIR